MKKIFSLLLVLLTLTACSTDDIDSINDTIQENNDSDNDDDNSTLDVCWQTVIDIKYQSGDDGYKYTFATDKLIKEQSSANDYNEYSANYGQAPSYHEGTDNECHTWVKAGNIHYLLKEVYDDRIRVYHSQVGSMPNSGYYVWYYKVTN